MINLASLSALIRTLRHTTGVDGPAAPVARVASVAPVADDDAGAMNPTALRGASHSRTTLPIELVARDGGEQRSETRTEASALRHAALPATTRTTGERASTAAAPPPPDSTALELTVTARLLQTALRGTGLAGPTPPTITASAPLVSEPRVAPAEIAQGLSRAVAESGLFYESHLSRVLSRDYAMAAVAREPQASWPVVGEEAMPAAAAAALPEGASALLSRQLDALDTRAVVWSGEVWPRRPATVAIEEQPAADDDAAAADSPAAGTSRWQTRVTIELPLLGRIAATLRLRGQSLDIGLVATTADAGQRLAAAAARLESSLDDAGMGLHELEVDVDAGVKR